MHVRVPKRIRNGLVKRAGAGLRGTVPPVPRRPGGLATKFQYEIIIAPQAAREAVPVFHDDLRRSEKVLACLIAVVALQGVFTGGQGFCGVVFGACGVSFFDVSFRRRAGAFRLGAARLARKRVNRPL